MWKSRVQLVIFTVGLFVGHINTLDTNQICQPITSCDENYKYRSVDGSCNNLQNPKWANALTAYGRILPNNYGDGKSSFPLLSTGAELPLSRKVSLELNPPGIRPDRRFTLALMQFGQIVAHDLSFTTFGPDIGSGGVSCCVGGAPGPDVNSPRCAPIYFPPDDPIYVPAGLQCNDFERTATTRDAGCTRADEVAEPLTAVSGFLDLNIVYGGTEAAARNTRTFQRGFLKVEIRNRQPFPQRADNVSSICGPEYMNKSCYGGGDVRMNQNPQLAVIQVALLREHNRVATELAALNPHWNDELLYQEARRIVVGRHQHVVYTEYIPRIIGQAYSESIGLLHPNAENCVNDYDRTVDASAIVESSSAALRALHSQIMGRLALVNEQRDVIGALRLIDYTNNAEILEQPLTSKNCDLGFDYLARGLAFQPPDYNSKNFDPDLKHYLFRRQGVYGIDLRALDIQRERDHGVGTYVQAREFCGLSVPTTFDDLQGLMPPEDIAGLRRVYLNINDVSLNSGGLLEYTAPGAIVGPTYQCILGEEFKRARVGDRFFYENCESNSFNNAQLAEIRKASLACMFCTTSVCIEKMQPQAFDPVSANNAVTDCDNLCKFDISLWRDSV